MALAAHAQTATVQGKLTGAKDDPIIFATIRVKDTKLGTTTDVEGNFKLTVPASRKITLSIAHQEYQTIRRELRLKPDEVLELNLQLTLKTTELKEVEVEGERENREEAGSVNIDIEQAKNLPTPFGEFNQLIISGGGLGVVGNNELSSTYSVRGGSFDENLVYVNNIQVYRPFLVRAGQQEGLSFVNPDLVQSIHFSSGGWQPKYGDKLSSSLNIFYRKPTQFSGSVSASLLGGNVHFEGASKDNKITGTVGARYKSSAYLLGTTETEGEYLPRFGDVQSYINIDLGAKQEQKKTELGLLFSYASNDYEVIPESRETRFGTFQQQQSLFVGFDGREILTYRTAQGGAKLSHRFNHRFTSHFIASGMTTREREYINLESGYRLCDIDNNISSETFDQCISVRGAGITFDYARNELDAVILSVESRNEWWNSDRLKTEFGFRLDDFNIDDNLYEYSFFDSADFVTLEPLVETQFELRNRQLAGYAQQTYFLDTARTLTYGARVLYNELNGEVLFSPRVQYAWQPKWKREIMFRVASGLYQQPPFYREMRNFSGGVNEDLQAQKSAHFIAGLDWNFQQWKRPFKLITEVYYKRLWDVVPYDLDNVRLRYYGQNSADAYVVGADFRISGEFIPGAESWFNVGILSTRENVEGDNRGYIRRPTDQRVTFSMFFQDHLPGNPSIRLNVRGIYGTGLPYGPPSDIETDNLALRNSLSGNTSYARVDFGFSKIIDFKEEGETGFGLKSIWIGLEVLNAFGIDNNISFTWISDFNNVQYAVPNSLSQRFFNARLIARF